MCHDNEEWCKIWREIDLSFQNWHEEFDKFWPEHLKVSTISTLMCSVWAEYILFELKMYREVIFHDTEEWYKIWRAVRLVLSKLTRGIWQILTWAHESLKNFHFNGLLLSKVYIAEELSFMTLKSDTKFGEESTCCFKIDIRNLTNFDLSTWKFQKFSL